MEKTSKGAQTGPFSPLLYEHQPLSTAHISQSQLFRRRVVVFFLTVYVVIRQGVTMHCTTKPITNYECFTFTQDFADLRILSDRTSLILLFPLPLNKLFYDRLWKETVCGRMHSVQPALRGSEHAAFAHRRTSVMH